MKNKKIHPYLIILSTFLAVILVGTILLVMPFASTDYQSFGFVDALFMSTSAVCVTGLSVMDISVEMTLYGKIVMALLMEIGGLSIITIAVFFFIIIGAKLGVSNRYLLKEALNQNSVKGIVSLVIRIIKTSLIIQGIGIIFNFIALIDYYDYDILKTILISTFHSIASFNNAGFDVFGSSSMIPFENNYLLCITTMLLIVVGSTGFIIIDDIVKTKCFKKLQLHSKITLITTAILIVAGMLMFKLGMLNCEGFNWLHALFSSITCRTAGFTIVDMSILESNPGAYITALALMFIGASPCSTGGGVKTTTFAIVMLAIIFFARGKKINVFKRSISNQTILKAFVLMTMGFIIVAFGTLLVGLVQPDLGIEQILFEVTSAFTTTGLSMGITSSLNEVSRLVLVVLMIFGRVGPLTIIGIVNKNWMSDSKEQIQYVEGSVIIG